MFKSVKFSLKKQKPENFINYHSSVKVPAIYVFLFSLKIFIIILITYLFTHLRTFKNSWGFSEKHFCLVSIRFLELIALSKWP